MVLSEEQMEPYSDADAHEVLNSIVNDPLFLSITQYLWPDEDLDSHLLKARNVHSIEEFQKQLISYISISLFVLLPLFTLFLKFFYIRRKFTYVEHLIFVFHTQTVFFLLLTLFYIIDYIQHPKYIILIFLLLFIVYLYLAMKRFYMQGHIKTFMKFILVNCVFFFVTFIGFLFVTLIAFAFY